MECTVDDTFPKDLFLMSDYRNPSPPSSPLPEQQVQPSGPQISKEGSNNVDEIAGTVFSKSWVLALLVRTVEYVSSPEEEEVQMSGQEGGEGRGETRVNGVGSVHVGEESPKVRTQGERSKVGCESSSQTNAAGVCNSGNGDEDGVMDPALEEDLCLLWDASMNSEVAEFLHSQHSVELLLGVATRATSLRLKEMSIGIVGNMACLPHICSQCLCSHKNIDQILSFLEDADPRILVETTRLVQTCLSHSEPKKEWLDHIAQRQEVMLQHLSFILNSSTNDDLLRISASLLDQLLDGSEELLREWAGDRLVQAICEAAEQTSSSSPDVTGSLLLSLQLLSTVQEGVSSLVSHEDRVKAISLHHLSTLDHIGPSNCSAALAAASLLLAIAKQHRDTSVSAIAGESRELLSRIHSEICDCRDGCSEETDEQFSSLRRILKDLLEL